MPINEVRKLVFDKATLENSTVSIDGASISLKFSNRIYSKGYSINVYSTKRTQSTLVGHSSYLGITLLNNGAIPADLQSNKEQQRCAENCTAGWVRDIPNITHLSCCWTCNKCPLHFYSTSTNADTCAECGMLETNNTDRTSCVPIDRDYLSTSSTFVMICLIGSSINLFVIILSMIMCVVMKSRPLIKVADPIFLLTFQLGLILGNIALILSLQKSTDTTCKVEYIFLILYLTLTTSSMSLRAMKINIIFSAANNFCRPRFGILCTRKGQVVMNAGIFIFNAMIAMVALEKGNSWTLHNYQNEEHGALYMDCKIQNSFGYIPLVLPGLMFLKTLYLAFVMRKFPHNFRETINIFAATLIVLFSSAMFLTGYKLSAPNVKPLLRAIMIYTTGVALLVSMMGPKIVILAKFHWNPALERENIDLELTEYASKDRRGTSHSAVFSSVRRDPECQ